MNDRIPKTKKLEEYVKHLNESFEILKKYNMKLNLEKCLFRVHSGNFLDS